MCIPSSIHPHARNSYNIPSTQRRQTRPADSSGKPNTCTYNSSHQESVTYSPNTIFRSQLVCDNQAAGDTANEAVTEVLVLRREKSRVAAKARRKNENQALISLRLALPMQPLIRPRKSSCSASPNAGSSSCSSSSPFTSTTTCSVSPTTCPSTTTTTTATTTTTDRQAFSNIGQVSVDACDSCLASSVLQSMPNYRKASMLSRQQHLSTPEFEKAVTIRLASTSLCLYNQLYALRHHCADGFFDSCTVVERQQLTASSISLQSRGLIGVLVDLAERTIVYAPPAYARLLGLSWNATIGLRLDELRARQQVTSAGDSISPFAVSSDRKHRRPWSSPLDISPKHRVSGRPEVPAPRVHPSDACSHQPVGGSARRTPAMVDMLLAGVVGSGADLLAASWQACGDTRCGVWACKESAGLRRSQPVLSLLPPLADVGARRLPESRWQHQEEVEDEEEGLGLGEGPSTRFLSGSQVGGACPPANMHFEGMYAVCWGTIPLRGPYSSSRNSTVTSPQGLHHFLATSDRLSPLDDVYDVGEEETTDLLHPLLRPGPVCDGNSQDCPGDLAPHCSPLAASTSGVSSSSLVSCRPVDGLMLCLLQPISLRDFIGGYGAGGWRCCRETGAGVDLAPTDISSAAGAQLTSFASFVEALPRSYHHPDTLEFLVLRSSPSIGKVDLSGTPPASPPGHLKDNLLFPLSAEGHSLLDLLHPDELENFVEDLASLSPGSSLVTSILRVRTVNTGVYRFCRLLLFGMPRDLLEAGAGERLGLDGPVKLPARPECRPVNDCLVACYYQFAHFAPDIGTGYHLAGDCSNPVPVSQLATEPDAVPVAKSLLPGPEQRWRSMPGRDRIGQIPGDPVAGQQHQQRVVKATGGSAPNTCLGPRDFSPSCDAQSAVWSPLSNPQPGWAPQPAFPTACWSEERRPGYSLVYAGPAYSQPAVVSASPGYSVRLQRPFPERNLETPAPVLGGLNYSSTMLYQDTGCSRYYNQQQHHKLQQQYYSKDAVHQWYTPTLMASSTNNPLSEQSLSSPLGRQLDRESPPQCRGELFPASSSTSTFPDLRCQCNLCLAGYLCAATDQLPPQAEVRPISFHHHQLQQQQQPDLEDHRLCLASGRFAESPGPKRDSIAAALSRFSSHLDRRRQQQQQQRYLCEWRAQDVFHRAGWPTVSSRPAVDPSCIQSLTKADQLMMAESQQLPAWSPWGQQFAGAAGLEMAPSLSKRTRYV